MNIRLRKKIKNKAAKLAKPMIEQAEKRADKAEKDYLKQNAKRESIYDKRIAYCDNLKEKTQAECNNIKAKAERDAEIYLAKARGVYKEMLAYNNEIITDQSIVNIFFKMAQSMQGNVNDYSKRAKDAMQKADNLNAKINEGRALRH